MNKDMDCHAVKLFGAFNVRDLGGYKNKFDRVTREGLYFRSDSLHNLTNDDIDKLRTMGVTMQIDLRSEHEATRNPSKLLGINGIKYLNVNFLDNINSNDFEAIPICMADLYYNLLDNYNKKLGIVFQALLSNEGSCIFNCTAGKDRTGVVAMLLLLLAEVDDNTIIEDYTISEINMTEIFEQQRQKLARAGCDIPEYIFAAHPDNMKKTLKYFREKYTDIRCYLRYCGLSQDEIERLKERFILH